MKRPVFKPIGEGRMRRAACIVLRRAEAIVVVFVLRW
jgi:hypothetical protein